MFTLGFPFHPWKAAKAIADGPSILEYLHETASTYGIDKHIRFGQTRSTGVVVVRRTRCGRWRRRRSRTPARSSTSAAATTTTTPGTSWTSPGWTSSGARWCIRSTGRTDLDYTGKRVVVIGSGATAVTLVPAMAPDGGARDDAAALPQLHRVPAGSGRLLRPAARRAAGEARPPADPRQERRLQSRGLQRVPALADACSLAAEQHGRQAVARLDPGRIRTSLRGTSRGTSGSAWYRTPTCSRSCGTARPRW